jgi:hypothetical protein
MTTRSLLPGRHGTVLRRIIPVVYLLIGVLVAAQHNDLTHLNTAGRILSGALAILLWPIVLLGVQLTIR